MARIIVLQHSPEGVPGRIGVTLRDHGLRLDVRRLDLLGAPALPTDLDDVAGVLSLGGPQNVGESHDWMDAELAFLKAAHQAELPVIGVCLGSQLIAAALGGDVAPMNRPEYGFAPVDVTIPGQTETILAGIPWRHEQFHAHGHEVTRLPDGATLLASSQACKVQAYRAGLRTFGFQFHFECDRVMIGRMAERSRDELAALGLSPEEIDRQASLHYERYALVSDRLAVNLATYCFPAVRLLAV